MGRISDTRFHSPPDNGTLSDRTFDLISLTNALCAWEGKGEKGKERKGGESVEGWWFSRPRSARSELPCRSERTQRETRIRREVVHPYSPPEFRSDRQSDVSFCNLARDDERSGSLRLATRG